MEAPDGDDFANALDRASLRVSQLLVVCSMFALAKRQMPDQLDKVDQHRLRIMRKKATIDARLKNSVQSQLDDITSGLSLLQKYCILSLPDLTIAGLPRTLQRSEQGILNSFLIG